MDYSIFERMNEFIETPIDQANGQYSMEKIIKEVLQASDDDKEQHIYNMLCCEFSECNYEKKQLKMEFPVQIWELNPAKTLHGGLLATAIDMTCGLLVRFVKESMSTATVHLSIDYLRPLQVEEDFVVEAKITKQGRNIIFLTAEVYSKGNDKIVATASGTFV